jgi:drug/metabolite transporter (DMT)-like permease
LILVIVIALTGTIILNIGFALQKSEVTNLPVISLREIRNTIRAFLGCKKWLLGTGLTSFGWVLFLIAISLAPLSLIAPLGNVGIIVIVLLSFFYFKEKLFRFEYLAFLSVIIGVFIISLNSSSIENVLEYDYFGLFILVFFILLFLGSVGLIQFSWFPKNRGIFLGLTSGITGGLGAVFTKTMILAIKIPLELTFFLVLFLLFQGLSFVTLQSAFQRERALIVVPLFNSYICIQRESRITTISWYSDDPDWFFWII